MSHDSADGLAVAEPQHPGGMKPTDMNVPDARGDWGNIVKNPLAAIQQNTLNMAKYMQQSLDLQRQTLGGAELGRLGVTPAELRGGWGHVPSPRLAGASAGAPMAAMGYGRAGSYMERAARNAANQMMSDQFGGGSFGPGMF